MLYTLLNNWEETPRMEEERMFDNLKTSVQNERMKTDLNKKKKDETPRNEIAEDEDVQGEEETTTLDSSRKVLEDDETNVMKMKLLVEEEKYNSYVWKTEKKIFAHTSSDEQTHQVTAYSAKTTDGLSSLRQFTQKKVSNITTARVSGQLASVFITKPQLV